jgi:hypothetical protein
MNAKKVLSKIVEFLSAEEVELTYAKLADGTIVESPTFDVGEDLSVVSEDGTKSPAPDGEHELMLKDEEGNENRMKVITKDGKIVERENVELADAEKVKAEPIPAVGNEDKENVMPDLKGQVKEGTQMAEVTEEATEDMPQTDGEPLGENEVESEEGEIEINLTDLKKMVEDMAYRIEEMEKKMMDMEKVKEEVVDKKPEEEKMAEEELPKLDGAPIEDNPLKFASEQNRKNYGQKVENYQTSFLSKLYN